jgi:hypothetical protein
MKLPKRAVKSWSGWASSRMKISEKTGFDDGQ